MKSQTLRLTALHKKCFLPRTFSRAKAQRRKALPRFRRFSLRLCAFAREIILATDAPWSFCAKPSLTLVPFRGWTYFLPSPLTKTSDRRDIRRYAGLSTDHIVSGMSSQEMAMAIFPLLV